MYTLRNNIVLRLLLTILFAHPISIHVFLLIEFLIDPNAFQINSSFFYFLYALRETESGSLINFEAISNTLPEDATTVDYHHN